MGKYDTTKEWAAAKLPLEAGHEIGAGCDRDASARRSAATCSPRWRLLTEGDKIQVGDEMLRDDCETWEAYEAYPAPGHHFIGCGYTPNLFVPIRRRIIPENARAETPGAKDQANG